MSTPGKLAEIDALKDEIEKLRPIDAEQERRVFQKFRLDWNFNSNAIEGNQLTYGETEMFLLHGLTSKGKPFKDYLDIRGHNEAIEFLLALIRQQERMTEAVIRELHKVLLVEPYWVNATTADGKATRKLVQVGAYKTTQNEVVTATGETFQYASPEATPSLVGDLVKWLNDPAASRELHPVAVAAVFHHRFLAIHPFDDGNGRLGRLLLNFILMQNRLPPVIIRAGNRDAYLYALRKADQGDVEDLVEHVCDEEIKSLRLLLSGARGEPIEELDDIDKEIALFKQKLRHIDDPVVLNLQVQRELFADSMSLLLRSLFNKMAKFDDLYSEAQIFVSGSFTSAQNMKHPFNQSQASGPKLVEAILELAAENIWANIDLQFQWVRFKKTPLKELHDAVGFMIKFEPLRYTIKTGNVNVERVYGESLSAEEIRGIVATVAKGRLEAAEKHAGLVQ